MPYLRRNVMEMGREINPNPLPESRGNKHIRLLAAKTELTAHRPFTWLPPVPCDEEITASAATAAAPSETFAPAFAKSGTIRSTGRTIRCTSMGTCTCGRIASHTSGPMVRFGT